MFDYQLQGRQLVLASSSPRRYELLKKAGFSFEILEIDFIETIPDGLPEDEVAIYLAEQKAGQIEKDKLKAKVIITADTIVSLDNTILGKPGDVDQAKGMLRLLSGRTHNVLTGVCLMSEKGRVSFVSLTKVKFVELSDKEINYYIDTCKPFDKAGSYGIQEWIGYIGVEEISGSYFNVMGLPVQRLYSELKKFLQKY
ncbi:MAG: Maf family protein [Bacteroidales bacterium]|nr:Maf family protein [Bacteroidales bacterium]